MKNSVLILGIALVAFSNISNAKNTVSLPSNLFQNTIWSDNLHTEIKNNEETRFEKPAIVKETEAEVFNPETVIAYNPKTVKEIIAENDKIVENTVSDDSEFMEYEESMRQLITQSDLIIENNISNEIYPLYFERTVEDEIAELELIIESTKTNEAKPLDFKKINNNPTIKNNIFNAEKFIGMN